MKERVESLVRELNAQEGPFLLDALMKSKLERVGPALRLGRGPAVWVVGRWAVPACPGAPSGGSPCVLGPGPKHVYFTVR